MVLSIFLTYFKFVYVGSAFHRLGIPSGRSKSMPGVTGFFHISLSRDPLVTHGKHSNSGTASSESTLVRIINCLSTGTELLTLRPKYLDTWINGISSELI